MALTTTEASRLTALETAYDKLITGTKVVSVAINGRATTFGQGNISYVKNEIDTLRAKRDSATSRTRGSIGFRVV